jgi:hypothetical protein
MDLYQAAKAFPGRTTSGQVKKEMGITINGQLPGQDRPGLLTAVDEEGRLLVGGRVGMYCLHVTGLVVADIRVAGACNTWACADACIYVHFLWVVAEFIGWCLTHA